MPPCRLALLSLAVACADPRESCFVSTCPDDEWPETVEIPATWQKYTECGLHEALPPDGRAPQHPSAGYARAVSEQELRNIGADLGEALIECPETLSVDWTTENVLILWDHQIPQYNDEYDDGNYEKAALGMMTERSLLVRKLGQPCSDEPQDGLQYLSAAAYLIPAETEFEVCTLKWECKEKEGTDECMHVPTWPTVIDNSTGG